jgi:hypothetical protein
MWNEAVTSAFNRSDDAIIESMNRLAGVFSAQNSSHAARMRIINSNTEEVPPRAASGRRGNHLIYHPRFAGWFGFRNRTLRSMGIAGLAIGERYAVAISLDSWGDPAGSISTGSGSMPREGCLLLGRFHTKRKLA